MKTLLILSQVYPPDPTSVGQHMHDAAAEMAKRGYCVHVLTANRGYNDPSIRYPSRETLDGVNVRRLPLSSLGKGSIFIRLFGAMSFLFQCVLRGTFTRSLSGILVSTSPPMCSAAALMICLVRRRTAMTYWVMDINPDQMVEMEWISLRSPFVKIFDWFNRRVLKRAENIVTLDRFMAERLLKKRDISDKLTVMPPWPHDDHLEEIAHQDNPFRTKHGVNEKFVVMYSGNHSVCTPLRTVLDAAMQLPKDSRIHFMFIGDGSGKKEVNNLIAEHHPNNMCSLPYQPLSEVKYSLSAADVHLVVVGDREVGVRHPCKIYGAMALSRPVLLLGPDPCHASDLVDRLGIGWHLQHGDVNGMVHTLQEMENESASELAEKGRKANQEVREKLNKHALCGNFCDLIEKSMHT